MNLIDAFKNAYKRMCILGLWVSRRVVYGYHPVLLEYPFDPRPRYGYGMPPHPELSSLIEANRRSYAEFLRAAVGLREYLAKIPFDGEGGRGGEEPYWNNRWLSGFDSLVLYAMIAQNKPAHYYEIGSGMSTRFVKRAVRDHGLGTSILSIDPHPREEVENICDYVIRDTLEFAAPGVFDDFEAGDILFVDGSHYCFQNSDVTVVFLDILPRLKPGVIVQVHDVFLPFDYPPEWRERYFSEQYLLATALLNAPERFTVLAPNAFIAADPELSGLLDPLWGREPLKALTRHGGSFWMKVN